MGIRKGTEMGINLNKVVMGTTHEHESDLAHIVIDIVCNSMLPHVTYLINSHLFCYAPNP